jgi:hypothetical protein
MCLILGTRFFYIYIRTRFFLKRKTNKPDEVSDTDSVYTHTGPFIIPQFSSQNQTDDHPPEYNKVRKTARVNQELKEKELGSNTFVNVPLDEIMPPPYTY